jgi:hypothetical protein
MIMIGMMRFLAPTKQAFMACACNNQSNVLESYFLLEPDICTVSVGNIEMETTVYGKSVQKKQDQIIPMLRYQIIETNQNDVGKCPFRK